MDSIAYGGLDVHSETITVAVIPELMGGVTRDIRERLGLPAYESNHILQERTIPNKKSAVQRYFRKAKEEFGKLRCCYEASSGGYVVQRWLKDIGIECDVIAPSKTPERAKEKKTDRLDARKLARLYRVGELSIVRAPTEGQERVRDLLRCRYAVAQDITRAKNRIVKFLQRRGKRFEDGKTRWTQKYWRYLRGLELEGEDKATFEEYRLHLEFLLGRQEALDQQVTELAQTQPYKEGVGKLCCLRGIKVLSAMVLITETIDFQRFGSAPQLMGYWGFGCKEDSTGKQRRQGSIDKAGNSRCRWILVEASWHYRHRPAISKELASRHQGQPPEVVAHAIKAQQRLHKKFWRVCNNTGEEGVAVVAAARELAGFVWAIMTGHCGAQGTDTPR